MKIFTIEDGVVEDGAVVEAFTLSSGKATIPAIVVGDTGRGRELGVLPVYLPSAQYAEWKEKGSVRVYNARLAQTKSGRPKLEVTNGNTGKVNEVIAIFRTPIGYRGGNSHTGDRSGWHCTHFGCDAEGDGPMPNECPKGPHEQSWSRPELQFLPFPGQELARERIAQGAAGRMGSGAQIVAVMPENAVFRTGYSGRRYGNPHAHYYILRDGKILSTTWEKRELMDLF